MSASSEPSRSGTKLVWFALFLLAADPKDWKNANIRIPWCADANCVNLAVFQVKFRRHSKNTITLGTLERFELLISFEMRRAHSWFPTRSAEAATVCVYTAVRELCTRVHTISEISVSILNLVCTSSSSMFSVPKHVLVRSKEHTVITYFDTEENVF